MSSYVAAVLALLVGAAALVAALTRRRARRAADERVAELHQLLLGFSSLRHVDDREAVARTICRIATELTEGTGAALYQPGPGRLLVLGHHGIPPAPPDPELGVSPELERVLRGARIRPGDPLLVPLTGAAGVIAAVGIYRPQRQLDGFTTAVLGLLGWAAGTALDRFGAEVPLEGRDPITGVGDRSVGTTAIASLHTGDAVVVCEVEGVGGLRQDKGDEAADVVQGLLGLHLRNAIRPGDVVARLDEESFVIVLREVRGPVDLVVRRILDTWSVQHPGRRLHIGAALHTPGAAPLDTAESARAVLFAARRS